MPLNRFYGHLLDHAEYLRERVLFLPRRSEGLAQFHDFF